MSWLDDQSIFRKYLSDGIANAGIKRVDTGEIISIPEDEIPIAPSGVAQFGDSTSSIAFQLAQPSGVKPVELAARICERPAPAPYSKIEPAGAGNINAFASAENYQREVSLVLEKGQDYSKLNVGRGKRYQIEFVSANPTGPMNIVSARAAAVGDAMCRVLKRLGYEVESEYYVNDHGRQVRLLGESLLARIRQARGEEAEIPENGYHGDYLRAMAGEMVASGGEIPADTELLARETVEKMVRGHRESLEHYGVVFDNWFSESELYEDGLPLKVVEQFRQSGHTYEKDGAVWFKSTEFGDTQDWVFVRSDEERSLTYTPRDIAYHRDKYERGYDRMIDLWGPDHHAHVAVTKAGMEALGYDPAKLDIIIVQHVNLTRGGEKVKMSKRAGEFVTMDELVAEVGVDAARYFFLMRSTDAPMDFDLDLAKEKSEKNPVYYVQYAHTRICSILREAEDGDEGYLQAGEEPKLELLGKPEEFSLMRKLNYYTQTVKGCGEQLEPHRLPVYLAELATAFHRFYNACRVLDSQHMDMSRARLALSRATKVILCDGLDLLGVSAPEKM